VRSNDEKALQGLDGAAVMVRLWLRDQARPISFLTRLGWEEGQQVLLSESVAIVLDEPAGIELIEIRVSSEDRPQ
jgi:hypothetical protein